MNIDIEIHVNDQKYQISILDITNHSEAECITDAMFQLADLRSYVDIIDTDKVKWRISCDDIYEISSDQIAESDLDSDMDLIVHIVLSIIKVIHKQPMVYTDHGYQFVQCQIRTYPYPYQYQYGQRTQFPCQYPTGYYSGVSYPYYGVNSNNVENSIDEDLLKEMESRRIKKTVVNMVKSTVDYKKRRDIIKNN